MAKDKSKEFVRTQSRTNHLWENAYKLSVHEMKEMILMDYLHCRNWAALYIGESGSAKNDAPKQVAEMLGIDFICFQLTNKEPTELAMPFVSNGVFSFHINDQLLPAFRPGWKGIIHIEEYPQAEPQMRRVVYSLIYDRVFNGQKLSDGALIMLSGNPPSESVYNLADLDITQEDRIAIHPMAITAAGFLKFAKNEDETFLLNTDVLKSQITTSCVSRNVQTQNIHPSVVAYIENDPQTFYEMYARRLHHFSDRLYAVEKYLGQPLRRIVHDKDQKAFLQNALIGAATPAIASKFVQYLLDSMAISGIEMLLGNKEHFTRMKKALASDAKMVALSAINGEISDALENHETTLVTKDDNGTATPVPVETAVTNYIQYLSLLLEHEPDTAIALTMDLIPKVEAKWDAFNRTFETITMKPENEWIIQKICDLQGIPEVFDVFKEELNAEAKSDDAKPKKKGRKKADPEEAATA